MLRLLLLLASRRPRGRAALTILGIALGVALGYGVHLVNRAAVRDLAASVRELAGQAELEVRLKAVQTELIAKYEFDTHAGHTGRVDDNGDSRTTSVSPNA